MPHRAGRPIVHSAPLASDAVEHLDATSAARKGGPHEVGGDVRVEALHHGLARREHRRLAWSIPEKFPDTVGTLTGQQPGSHARIRQQTAMNRGHHRVFHRGARVEDHIAQVWPLAPVPTSVQVAHGVHERRDECAGFWRPLEKLASTRPEESSKKAETHLMMECPRRLTERLGSDPPDEIS